ncbi:MAG: hypothetical protein HYX68_14180 [Planctomycetes bacterium]|nr:hypothetical protein [Planctomycetota bacterium]
MFTRLWLSLLEFRLQHELGKHDAFVNECHERRATSAPDRIQIAYEILARPPLELSQRWYEYVRLTNRGEHPW